MLKSLVDSLDNKQLNLPTISPCLNISPSSSLSSSSFSNSSRQSASFTSTSSSTDKSSDTSFKNLKMNSNEINSKKLEKIEETLSGNNNKAPLKPTKTKKFSFGFGKKLRNFLSSDKNRKSTNVLKIENVEKKVVNLNEIKLRTKNIEEIRLNLQNKLK